MPIRQSLAGSYRDAVVSLLVAVTFLLLIACANVSNLLLVKASARKREIAVRTALGATRRRLVRQLFSESVVLGAAGGIGGLLLVYAGLPALLSLAPVELPHWMNFSADYRVLLFAVGVCRIDQRGLRHRPGVHHLRRCDRRAEGGWPHGHGVAPAALRQRTRS